MMKRNWKAEAIRMLQQEGLVGALVCIKGEDGSLNFEWGPELSDGDVLRLTNMINDQIATKTRRP